MGMVNDYSEIDQCWGELVENEEHYINFLGFKRLIEPTVFTRPLILWPHVRFYEPHLAFHPLVNFTSEICPSSVLCGDKENIFSLKPFMDVWDRVSVG